MKIRILASMAMALAVSGCVSMAPHDRLTGENSEGMGKFYAMAEGCHAVGSLSANQKEAYQSSVSNYLGYAIYDKKQFTAGQELIFREFNRLDIETVDKECRDFREGAPKVNAYLVNRYRSLAQARSAAWSQMAQGISDTGNSMNQSASSFNNPMPAPNVNQQPSFGLPQNNTDHYLINTPGGQRQCFVNGNYVNCM